MYKPASLRQALIDAVPELGQDNERLLVYIKQGSIAARPTNLSFSYSYDLELLVLDFQHHPDILMITVLNWLRIHQVDLLQNANKMQDGFTFESEPLNHTTSDIAINLKLTESVRVDGQGSTQTITHLAEPVADFIAPEEWRIYLKDVLIGTYRKTTPDAPATTIPKDEQ